jgi:hypothetical protein
MDASYVAGFFDGEGCGRVTKVGGKGGRRKLWKPTIEMSNTNKKVIDDIHAFIKVGKVYPYKGKRKGRKTQYRIYIWGYKEITQFCDLIIDKVIVKKEILELVRAFARYVEKTRYKHKVWCGKHVGWTDEDIQFVKAAFVIPIRDLIRTSSNKGKRTVMV